MRLWEYIEKSVKGNMLEMARTNMNGKSLEIWRGRAHLDGEWGSRKGLLEAAVVGGAERHKQERTQAPTQLSPTSQRQLHTCCGF